MRIHSALVLLVAIGALVAIPQQAQADRTTQINNRLENQSGRIQRGKGKHKMNAGQQTAADERDYRIEAQEQAMRAKHGGNLTKQDQRRLNRELNGNSRRIHNDKHE